MSYMTGNIVSDFIMRAPVPDDAQAISDLIVAYDTSISKQPDNDLSVVTGDWNSPGFDLNRDARIIATASGKVIGYEVIYSVAQDGRIKTDGYVHPDVI